MKRMRSIVTAATIASSLVVLSTPVVVIGAMLWQMHGPALAPSLESRVVFDGRTDLR